MNKDLTDWIWNSAPVTDRDRLVALALAYKANLIGETTIKLDDLASLCRCYPAEVRECLRNLVKTNQIQIFQNQDAEGKRTTNTYKFIVGGLGANGEEDDIEFESPEQSLPGIPAPKVRDLPPPTQPKPMMDAAALAAIAADELYEGLDVHKEAWRFKRWCAAHQKDCT